MPRTAVFGAILTTGLLGGAIASKMRLEEPLFSQVLFGVYVGVLAWGGLYLRDGRLRACSPASRPDDLIAAPFPHPMIRRSVVSMEARSNYVFSSLPRQSSSENW